MDLRELALTQETAGRHPWEWARADAVEFLLSRRAGVSGATRVLDFGCGDAFLVSHLARRFDSEQVYAVDKAFTPEVKARIQPALGQQTGLYDSIEALEGAAPRPADLVLLLDVLEHCEHDGLILDRLVESPAVAPGATFLITVPAFQGLFSKHDDFLGHYRRYSLPQLRRVVEQAGLKVEESSYFFSSLLAPRALQVALERLNVSQRNPKGLGDYEPKKHLDAAIRGILRLDFRVCEQLSRLGIRVPGLSCYVLGRKDSTGRSRRGVSGE